MPKIKPLGKNESIENQYYNGQNTYEDSDTNLKNKNFIQLYDNSNEYILSLILEDSTAAAVFILLSRFAHSNNTIIIERKQIAEILNKSEATIKRAIKTLKDINFLVIIKKGRNNVYFLNPQVVANCKAQYKSKLLHLYKELSTNKDITPLQIADNINNKKYDEFVKADKFIYKLPFKDNADEPDINEIMDKLEALEQLNQEQKKQKELEQMIDTMPPECEMTDDDFRLEPITNSSDSANNNKSDDDLFDDENIYF